MAKTIIQTIGPLYGEVVNGTVFGRPNGSIFVPATNTIEITLTEDYRYIGVVDASRYRICDSEGNFRYGSAYSINFVAQVQDLSSDVQVQIFSDSDCTDLVASQNLTAGIFNSSMRDFTTIAQALVDGTTYYLRAQVMNNSSPVATSNIIQIEGVVTE